MKVIHSDSSNSQIVSKSLPTIQERAVDSPLPEGEALKLYWVPFIVDRTNNIFIMIILIVR